MWIQNHNGLWRREKKNVSCCAYICLITELQINEYIKKVTYIYFLRTYNVILRLIRVRWWDFVAFAETFYSVLVIFFLDSLHLEPSKMFWKAQGIYLFWFLRPPHEFAKPRITNPRRARDDCILYKPPGSIRVIYYSVPLVRVMRK